MKPESIISREESMRVLRAGGVPAPLIGAAFGVSRQYVGALLGPRRELGPREVPEEVPGPAGAIDVPNMLRAWRKRHGMSQAAAAAVMGVRVGTVAAWEQGAAGCSLPVLLARFVAMHDEKNAKKVSESA